MSDTNGVKLSEECWCGTEVTVEGVTWEQAQDHVVAWRDNHRHREPQWTDQRGSAATGFSTDRGVPTMNGRRRMPT